MTELTANEKAATLIGWYPNKPCQGECRTTRVQAKEFVEDAHGGIDLLTENIHDPHSVKCPDMSDPRNYMRALEVVRQSKDGSFRLSSGEHVAGLPIFCMIARGEREGVGRETHESRAIIKALAALYDAEHAAP